jgi:DNA-binding NarL/FixJ family response regulator
MSHVTILVAEDFAPFREFACRELQRRPDFEVVAVADGLAAVEHAHALTPDVILLDIGLPSLNGLAAARRIRALLPAARIIFVTQESSAEVVHEALTLGAQAYIQKTSAQYLLATVEAIVGDQTTGNDTANGQHPVVDGRHHVHFCSDDATLIESAEHHLASALEAHGAAVAFATRSHVQQLLPRLRRRGTAVEQAIDRGAFVHLDAEELASHILHDDAGWQADVARTIESAAAATMRPHPRVAIVSECASMLMKAGHVDRAIGLERQPLEVAHASVDLLCAYPLLRDDHRRGFKAVCAHHDAIAVR